MSIYVRVPLFVLAFASVLCDASAGYAFNANLCSNGQLKGIKSARTFELDTANIPPGGARDQDVQRMFAAWNELPGTADWFRWRRGDNDNVAEGDDRIHFVSAASLGTAWASTSWTERSCLVFGGALIDVKTRVSDALINGPTPANALTQSVRGVLAHEMGHALGGNHDTRMANMLYNPNWGSLRMGIGDAFGSLSGRQDGFIADDMAFAIQYHGNAGTVDPVSDDYASSGQGFDPNLPVIDPVTALTRTRNIHSGTAQFVAITACRGQQLTYAFTVINRGRGNPGTWVDTVLSSDLAFTASDGIVDSWQVYPAVGTYGTFISSFQVPSLPNGFYFLGHIVDSFDELWEYDEQNNASFLNVQIQINC